MRLLLLLLQLLPLQQQPGDTSGHVMVLLLEAGQLPPDAAVQSLIERLDSGSMSRPK
jgi:hypothetical protein